MSVWPQAEKLQRDLRAQAREKYDKDQKALREELAETQRQNSEKAEKFQRRIQGAKASGKMKD